MRRLLLTILLTLFGLGAGLAIGAIVMRRVDRAAARMAPDNLVAQAARVLTGTRERARTAWEAGAAAAAAKEAELRARLGTPTPAPDDGEV